MKHNISIALGFFIEVLVMKPLKEVATVNPNSGRTWHMKYNLPVHPYTTHLTLFKALIHTYLHDAYTL